MQANNDDHLSEFRNQWRQELTTAGEVNTNNSEEEKEDTSRGETEEDDLHSRARDLFMQGVEYEQDGKLYEAVRYYRKAEKLVPNIEQQAYKFNINAKVTKVPVKNNQVDDNGNAAESTHCHKNEDDKSMANLCAKFSRLQSGQCNISKDHESSLQHIGDMPGEVINYILKWVVSDELDLKSLESCSQVCRGLYMSARDEEIWRLVCCKVWGQSVLSKNHNISWRELFLTRKRVNYGGCYISRMRYIREGERGFQDQETYRAWHIVEYSRYLRFFPGGQVIMALSSDDEAIIAKQLNTKTSGLNIPGAIMGRYKIVDDVVVCVLHKLKNAEKKKQKRRGRKEVDWGYEVPDQDFHLEFCISRNKLLEWKHFSIVSKYTNGNERVDNFEIRDKNKYPRYVSIIS